jgi:hypothetical protein
MFKAERPTRAATVVGGEANPTTTGVDTCVRRIDKAE